MICPSCLGTGVVHSEAGFDEDHYPLYRKARCPYCFGKGKVDLGEIYLVPRGMIKDEFFVSPEYGEQSQRRLRRILEAEKEFLEKHKEH